MTVTLLGVSIGAMYYGLKGVAIGYVSAVYVVFLPQLFYCFHNTPIRVRKFFNTLFVPTAVTFGGGVIMVITKNVFTEETISSHGIILICYALFIIAFSYPRKITKEILSKISKISL